MLPPLSIHTVFSCFFLVFIAAARLRAPAPSTTSLFLNARCFIACFIWVSLTIRAHRVDNKTIPHNFNFKHQYGSGYGI